MEISPANRKAIALLFLVFVLGIAFGAVGITVVNRRVYGARLRTGADQTRPVNRFAQDLNLTSDQQKQVSEILSDMQAKYAAIRKGMSPQFDQVRQQGRDEIRQVLTPEQKTKFDASLQRIDDERRKRAAEAPARR
jgi:Spy/CpxP family protein refolding chaperone